MHGNGELHATVQLRLDQPRNAEGNAELLDEQLRCARLAEIVLAAPDLLAGAVASGHADRNLSASAEPRLLRCDVQALIKTRTRCRAMVAAHEKDLGGCSGCG